MAIIFPGEQFPPSKPDLEFLESFDNSAVGSLEKFQEIGTVQSTVDSLTVIDIRASDDTQIFTVDTVNKWVLIGGAPAEENQDPNVSLFVTKGVNGYHAINLINTSNGAFASADMVVANNTTDMGSGYVDFGVNGLGWNDPDYAVFDAGAGFVYSAGNNFYVGTSGTGKNLYFFLGGTDSKSYIKVYINSDGVLFPVQATTAAAPTYVKGGMYFDTTLNKMRIGGATAWETLTSA